MVEFKVHRPYLNTTKWFIKLTKNQKLKLEKVLHTIIKPKRKIILWSFVLFIFSS